MDTIFSRLMLQKISIEKTDNLRKQNPTVKQKGFWD